MHFISDSQMYDGVVERDFLLDGIPGILWTPASAAEPVPLILMGSPGGLGLDVMRPRLAARARRSATDGFAAVALELPGSGDRPRIAALEDARTALRQAVAAGEPVSAEVIDRLVLPLVDQAVPECQAALDAILGLPEIGGRVGFSGGNLSVAIRMAAVEPRIAALGLFAGSFIPKAIVDDARNVTIPVHMLLQWDDEGNDRQASLDLFDALGSPEKTLCANLGGHAGVPAFAGDEAARFFARHLR